MPYLARGHGSIHDRLPQTSAAAPMLKGSDRFSNRIRVHRDMRGVWVWQLVTPDGHIVRQSEPFGEDRDACEADAKRQGLPIEGLARKKRVQPE